MTLTTGSFARQSRSHQVLSMVALLVAVVMAFGSSAAEASSASSTNAPGHPAALDAQENTKTPQAAAADRGKPVAGQYVVTVAEGRDPAAAAKGVGANPKFVYRTAINGFTAKLTEGQVRGLRHNPHIESIQLDEVIQGEATQYITQDGQPWGLDRIDQRTGLSGSFTYYGTGAGVTAYIIDSGIMTAHGDFGGRARNVFDAFGGSGQDCHGHGTHVAGTVGGSFYGVAKRVQLRGVKVLNCANSGTQSGIIAGVDWVMRNAVKPAVANISIGSPYYGPTNTAVTNLTRSGVFVSVSAGNENSDACTRSPASAAGTLTVASSNWYDQKASDSNWGACVDTYAPGVQIRSARLGGGTIAMSGTSMASPHVAGIAALIKGNYGEVTSPNMVSYILSYTTPNVVKGNYTGTPNRLLFQAGW
jgi:subtilisin family serine protease